MLGWEAEQSSRRPTRFLAGGLTLGANPITFGGAGALRFLPPLFKGAGGSITKCDAGVLTLSAGVTHTYTGTTNVLGGTMIVDGTLDNSGAGVTVGNGTNAGTGRLMGSGTIQRSVTIAKGGTIAPGTALAFFERMMRLGPAGGRSCGN